VTGEGEESRCSTTWCGRTESPASPDGETVSYVTTRARRSSHATARRRARVFAAGAGGPSCDGLAVDVEGGVWVALGAGGGVAASRRRRLSRHSTSRPTSSPRRVRRRACSTSRPRRAAAHASRRRRRACRRGDRLISSRRRPSPARVLVRQADDLVRVVDRLAVVGHQHGSAELPSAAWPSGGRPCGWKIRQAGFPSRRLDQLRLVAGLRERFVRVAARMAARSRRVERAQQI